MSLSISCSDDRELQAPAADAPQLSQADLTGGRFAFLAPLGRGDGDGIFNPRHSPVVEICHLATSGEPTATTPCATIVAWFGTDGGSGDGRVSVDTRRDMYSAVWNLAKYSLATGYYRISVGTARSGDDGTVFGYADVAVARSNNEARALAGPGVHPLTSTSDLPIKFRIEEGALCGDSPSCFEGSVGPDGGTFVTPDEFAGVEFPAGALNTTRTLVVERVTDEDVAYCLPTHHPQYEGCYRYRLEPAPGPGEVFELEAIVGVCLDPAAVPFEDELELQKWDEVDPASLTSLPRRDVEFLECEGFSLASIDASGTFATLASAGGRFVQSIASVFLPAPLHAATKSPYGGGLNDFSRIGWVRPLSIEAAVGNGQTVCTDTTLPVDPGVRVTSLISGEPMAGVPVKFGLLATSGSLSSSAATTDADGVASVSWTLGDVAGSHVMPAAALNPLTGWPQWTATPAMWGVANVRATATTCAP